MVFGGVPDIGGARIPEKGFSVFVFAEEADPRVPVMVIGGGERDFPLVDHDVETSASRAVRGIRWEFGERSLADDV